MNLTSFKLRLRKYGALIATLAVVMVAGISLATIWFLQQNQGAVAPNAPDSQPQASGNVCSVEWVVRNGCSDFKLFNADTGVEMPVTQPIAKGTKIQWSCAGLPGTNFYRYSTRSSATADFTPHYEAQVEQMADPANPRSTTFDTANLEYLELFCRPFAGDFGATMGSVRNQCQRVITFEAAPLAQCSQACSTDANCSAGLTCSGGMCRNPACTGEVSCTCPGATPAPTPVPTISCADATFTEDFADSTLSDKFAATRNNFSVSNGNGVIASEPGGGGSIETKDFVRGDIFFSVDAKSFASTPGTADSAVDFYMIGAPGQQTYIMIWTKGPNGKSQLRTTMTGPNAEAGSAAVDVPSSGEFTVSAYRTGSTMTLSYQLPNQPSQVLKTFTSDPSVGLRPYIRVRPVTANGENATFTFDNLVVKCDATVPTPPPTPVACEAAAFTEAFADTTLDVKLRKVGAGQVAVANGRATMSVTSEVSQFVAVEGREFVQGNFQTSVDLSDYTTASGNGIVETGLVTATSNWEKQYRVTWQKGANNSTSRLLVQSVVPGTTASPAAQFTTLNTTEIAANAAVTLRAVREGGTLRFYSQQSGQTAVLLASVSTTEALRPVVLVTPNSSGRSMSVQIDNFALVCDTTIPTPPPGPVSCNNTCTASSQCGAGLTCNGGVCRNPSCTNESSCTCPVATATPVPASCNNTCSANSDCGSGLTCSGGVCRNPSCTNQSSCTCPTATPVATATPAPGSSATPRPTTTTIAQATPTPTPPASCGNTCVTSSDCRNGLTCSNGQCRNPSCNDKTNCVCDVAPGAPAPTPAPELPQAGSVGQTVAILTAGAAVVAIGLGRWYYFKR